MMAAPNWAASAGEPLISAGNFAGGNVIDAEFETVSRDSVAKFASSLFTHAETPASNEANTRAPDQLSLLRSDGADATTHPDRLTPAFMFFTLLAAFVVFWVSGGHVLLY
jgi:Ca2+-binding RTX toxin-like protein